MGKQSFMHTPQLPGWQRISLTNLESAVSQCNWVSAGEPWTTKLATKALELVQDEQKTNQQKVPRSKWSARVFFFNHGTQSATGPNSVTAQCDKGREMQGSTYSKAIFLPINGRKTCGSLHKERNIQLATSVCVCVRVCCSPTHSCGYTEDGSYIGMK